MSHRSSLGKNSSLALFDFDGTITRRDSLFDFIQYYRRYWSFIIGIVWLLPTLVKFKLKLISNQRAKERVLSYFFAQEPLETFQRMCDRYGQQRIPMIVKESALKAIQKHKQRGTDVYLVSASAENWLATWCQSLDIGLIATRLEVKDNKITGSIRGKNCHGPEKVVRIRQEIDLSQYDTIYGYGDSQGDKPMLALVHVAHYRFFT